MWWYDNHKNTYEFNMHEEKKIIRFKNIIILKVMTFMTSALIHSVSTWKC